MGDIISPILGVHACTPHQQLNQNVMRPSQFGSTNNTAKSKPILIRPKPKINGVIVDSNGIGGKQLFTKDKKKSL